MFEQRDTAGLGPVPGQPSRGPQTSAAQKLCINCGEETLRHAKALLCMTCAQLANDASNAANGHIKRAIARGEFRSAREFDCVDCSAPAEIYDHRSYKDPFVADPVCRSCNIKRGPANDFRQFQMQKTAGGRAPTGGLEAVPTASKLIDRLNMPQV
jgi:hypothetical protein